ncbi:MAG: N-acetylmuramoyl-L-alanine amidase [Flavobacterium sp.]
MKKIYFFLIALLFSFNANSQIIVIDPGHGYGATVSDNPDGRTAIEIETSLEVGLRTKTLIQNSCVWTAQMTRTTNVNGWISVNQRALMSNNWNADRLLSIHCNAGGGTGTETFYCTDTDTNTAPDIAFATKIQADMVTNGVWNNRRCVEDHSFLAYHLGVLKYSSATACLNEIGFVDSADATKLTSTTWRDKFALAYFNAFQSDLNLTCTVTPAPGAFTLTATPECNTTTSQVKLTWTASANATSYDVYRNSALYTNVTGTQFTNTAVTVGTSYTYSVKAKNAGTTQVANSNGTLSVTALNCAIPGAFTLTATAECVSTTSRVNLTWTASANATGYDVYRNGVVYASNVAGTQYINTAVTAGTVYTYSVKAKNTTATQVTNSNGTLSVTAVNCAVPGAFTLTLTPECNASATSQIKLTWTASANATSYDIYRNGALYASDIVGTQFLNTYLITGGTTYTYSVKAKNNIGQTANSNGTLSVTAISCPPGTFTLTATPDCASTTSRINLTWTASAGATTYDIYRNGNLYASDVTGTQFLNTYLITAGSTYTFSMVAKNSAGTIANSNGTLSVTAISCSGARIVSETETYKNEITLYPNPSNGDFYLNIDNALNKVLDISIFNLNGQNVYTSKSTSLDETSNNHIDIKHLPSGIYLIKIAVDGKEYNKKIIKE